MNDSIFRTSLRTFFVALFGIAGIVVGFVLILALIGIVTTATEAEPQINYTFTPEIMPNAQGVRKSLSEDAPVVLKVNIDGFIGIDSLTSEHIVKLLIESRERTLADNRVKAILLHINSPGGIVVEADGIYRALLAYKEQYKTPIYAYVDGLCASGGVYIAAAADMVYANDTSLIGSVGVVLSPMFNFSQLMEKVGVQSMTLSDGKDKDVLNPYRPWKTGEENNIKATITYYYDAFLTIVTKARPRLDRTKLVNEYGADVFPAPLAKEYGYIDVSGANYSQTLTALVNKIGIEDDFYQVIELSSKNWVSELFKSHSNLLQGTVVHRIDLGPEFHPQLMNQYLYLYRP